MENQPIEINISLDVLKNKYLAKIQNLRDVIYFLESGTELVTEDHLEKTRHFLSFEPMLQSKLGFEESKEKANSWLLCAFLRDSIEITGLFLDECLQVCSLIEIVAKGRSTEDELKKITENFPKKFHSLHFPQKIEALTRKFEIKSPIESCILSLNKARTCLVHRQGRVAKQDVDESNKLKITLKSQKIIATGVQTGNELVINEAQKLPEESKISIRVDDSVKFFDVNDTISLTTSELYDCITTYFLFGNSLMNEISIYAKRSGALK